MQAVRMHAQGGPEVLVLEDAPEPRPGPGEVLVRVRACALNHLDLWVRQGPRPVSLPHILGSDVAGVVASGPRAGARVMIQPGLGCQACPACLAGRDNCCPEYRLLGAGRPGGYAEYVAVPERNLVAMPPGLDFAAAAAVPLTFTTAWEMVVTRGAVGPADVVLVLAAGSGVGAAAVQIARLHGATVIATAGGPAKGARALALGAHHVVDHYREDVAGAVKDLTGGRGADLVIEHVGQATWNASLAALAPGGRLVTCGATTGAAAAVDIRSLYVRQVRIEGSFMGSLAHLHAMQPFFRDGRLKSVVDRTLPLAEAAAAHRILEGKEQFGKVVLLVD